MTGTWFEQLYDKYGKPFEEADNFKWYKQNNFLYFPGEYPPNNIFYNQNNVSQLAMTNYNVDVNGINRGKANNKSQIVTMYDYNSNGILSSIKNINGYFPDETLSFTRDKSGLITGLNGSKRFNATYNLDLEISSVQHTLPQSFDETYTYDTRGNRLTSLNDSFTYDDQNRLISSLINDYQYDADGNLIQEKNRSTTETKKYYYDSESRMIAFEHYPTEVSPEDMVAEYAYDIYGRRIQKTVNGNVTKFFWYGDNLAYELDSQNKPIRRYFWDYAMDDYEGHLEYAEASNWSTILDPSNRNGWYFYLKDQVGTVYKVVDGRSNTVVDSRVYDVFGNLVSQSGTSKSNIGFQGKYYDKESGLYYFYHRYYSPKIGRFTTEDPIGFNSALNFMNFAENNAINYKDPFGFDSLTELADIKGAMCCILEKSGVLGGNWTGENSFMVDCNFNICYGQTSGLRTTTGRFFLSPGCKMKAFFHTHPPNGTDNPSGEDMAIYDVHGCTVYVIGNRRISKYCGKMSNEGWTQSLIGWCLSNRSEWECDCKK